MFEDRKIIVLDDDPTGTQTVHDIAIFTNWEEQTLLRGFQEKQKMFFILTNSRSFSRKKTIEVHKEIGRRIRKVSEKLSQKYLVISRGDSTLRGHYPDETEALQEGLGISFDGEIICPFFPESGRYTSGNFHYVQMNGALIPVGETEFAKDKTFGFKSSNLCDWVEEKTKGRYKAGDCQTIPENTGYEMALNVLMKTKNFQKVIVNATTYKDIREFAKALDEALRNGKNFLFRTAAAFVKIVGEVSDQPLLDANQICESGSKKGGMIIIGSHVQKTTKQLDSLKQAFPDFGYFEFDAESVLDSEQVPLIQQRAVNFAQKMIDRGRTVVIYTSRRQVEISESDIERQLQESVKISDALTAIPGLLSSRPRYLIAKGGITSSDVATKALRICRAEVLGQLAPGIPVWHTGAESRFPGLCYIIFPGNVGTENTLRDIVKNLEER